MIKSCVCLTPQQMEKLKECTKETGLTISDIVRRACDLFFERRDEKRIKRPENHEATIS